jgi:hypothetical protein
LANCFREIFPPVVFTRTTSSYFEFFAPVSCKPRLTPVWLAVDRRGEPDLFGAAGRGGRPIHGAVHDLTHAIKPPEGAGRAGGMPGNGVGVLGLVEFEFELRGRVQVHNFEFFGLSVAGDVGQKLSKVRKSFGIRILNGGCWRGRSCAARKSSKSVNSHKKKTKAHDMEQERQFRTAGQELSVVRRQLRFRGTTKARRHQGRQLVRMENSADFSHTKETRDAKGDAEIVSGQ